MVNPRIAPSVSVIVPMYNLSLYIAETLDSLKAQKLEGVEYLLIDDGSTDNTVPIVETTIDQDPRFRLVTQENRGPSAARNHGLKLAQGEYICFVDGDDRLDPSALEVMYKAAHDHGADMVTGDTRRFDRDRSWPLPSYARHKVSTPGIKTLATHPELIHALGPCAKLFRRSLLDGVFFPETIRLGEDQPLVLFALAHSATIVTVDAVVYHYRVRNQGAQSLTQTAMTNPIQALEDLYEMVRLSAQVLEDPDLMDAYLTRVLYADVWPRAKSALKTGDPRIQITALNSLGTWLTHFDDDQFNRVPALYSYPLACLLSQVHRIHHEARGVYYRILRSLLSKMNLTTFMSFVGRLVVSVPMKMLKRKRG